MTMDTSTAVVRPGSNDCAAATRWATPFFVGEEGDATARLPALRVVLRREDMPAESLRQLAGFVHRCRTASRPSTVSATDATEPQSPTERSGVLGGGSVGMPLFDGWIARFENRGSTVSVIARDRTLLASSVAPSPLGWRRSVAANGVVCIAFDVRSSPEQERYPGSTDRTVLEACLPVRLG